MATEPSNHDPDERPGNLRDPRRSAQGDADGGRGSRPVERSVLTSPAGNIAFVVVVTACAVGVLGHHGRDIGMAAVAGVNAFALLIYFAFRRSFDRIEAGPVEGLVSWLIWTLLIGTATAFYVLDWRILGAGVLGVVLMITFTNMYFVAMRPEVVDRWIREARDPHDPHDRDDADRPPDA